MRNTHKIRRNEAMETSEYPSSNKPTIFIGNGYFEIPNLFLVKENCRINFI